MGIIETIKMITREEGIEEGIGKGREEGIELGIEKTTRDMIKTLLLNTDFDNQKIAAFCKVEESEVKQMREDLGL